MKFSDFDFEKQTVRISRQLVASPKVKKDLKLKNIRLSSVILNREQFRIPKVPKAIMKEVERRLHYVEMKKRMVRRKL